MIWVTWRQHRPQALTALAAFALVAVYALVLGLWMRSTFDADAIGTCLARSGGAGCGGTISSFMHAVQGGAAEPLNVVLLVVPGLLGATVGAPLLGQELERGTWQLAWTQTVPRTRWLVAKLGLIIAALAVFGAALTAIVAWSWSPLDQVSSRTQPPQFVVEGVALTCSLLCAFGLALLAGLLLRNTIGAMVAGYFAWELCLGITLLLTGPLQLFSATKTIPCAGTACAAASTSSAPPVTGNLGDLVNSVTQAGDRLVVNYVPASAFWPLQFVVGGIFLAVGLVAAGAAVWLLRRRTT
jgi:ABC-type transport system involved in multi-copper enzyme maturation permease subunit